MSTLQVSIIIATRNRETILWQTVHKAVEAAIGRNVEIIIVNDGDEKLAVPKELKSEVKQYDNPGKGVTAARNFGASKANGDILFFIDDDMWINAGGLDWIFRFMQTDKARESVYNLNWQYPDGLNEKLTRSKVGKFLINANYHRMWGRMKEKGDQPVSGLHKCHSIASCSLLMDKNLFKNIGGYNEEFVFQGEDIELSNRLNSLHIPIYAVFDVNFSHNHQDRLEIDGFLQRVTQGYKSEFEARAKGLLPNVDEHFKGGRKTISELLTLTEPFWMLCYKLLPNTRLFDKPNIRIVGMLSGLQRFKQWKRSRT